MSLLQPNNLLWAEWISFSSGVTLLGIICLSGQHFVPECLQRVFKYGKTATEPSTSGHPTDGPRKSGQRTTSLDIPKRWFFHFYVFATIFYLLLLWTAIRVYVFRSTVPQLIRFLLDHVVGHQRRPNVSSLSVLLSTVLMQIQVTRRLLECTQLSVYSSSGRMSILHYLCGFFFYFGVGLSLLAEASGFQTSSSSTDLNTTHLSWSHVLGVTCFLLFSWAQFKCHVILAKLRTDSTGRVFTYRHSVPEGFLFELVSCPHYLCEILIYLSLLLLQWCTTWWMVCSFVSCNQIIVGLFNHFWYKQNFPKYPQKRKAVLPFLL